MPPRTKRNPNAKFHRPTRGELFAIGRLLEQHCHKLPDGYSHYDKGWDDATIAKAVGDHIAIASVAFYRGQEYGKLRDATRGAAIEQKKKHDSAAPTREALMIQNLQRQVDAIEREKRALEETVAALAAAPRRIAEIEALMKMLQVSGADLQLRHSSLMRRFVRLEQAHNKACAILGAELDKRFIDLISGTTVHANGADSKPGETA